MGWVNRFFWFARCGEHRALGEEGEGEEGGCPHTTWIGILGFIVTGDAVCEGPRSCSRGFEWESRT
jgi:hypothetical protein